MTYKTSETPVEEKNNIKPNPMVNDFLLKDIYIYIYIMGEYA